MRCQECLGADAHGLVHVRHPQGGGGYNRPCSRAHKCNTSDLTPGWREDKTARMLGVSDKGCPQCGYGFNHQERAS